MVKIISIGYRCITDEFLKKFNKRFFSGPFSYLFVDFETSIKIIHDNFKKYFTNIETINNNNYQIKFLPHWRMTKKFYVNKYYTSDLSNNNIYDLQNLLIWNHHDITNKKIKETFVRRIKRIQDFMKNNFCIFFYIDRIYEGDNIDNFIDIKILSIIKRYYKFNTHNILYILPFSKKKYLQYDTKLYKRYDNVYIYLIYSPSISKLQKKSNEIVKHINRPLIDTDLNNNNIKWNSLYENIKYLFNKH